MRSAAVFLLAVSVCVGVSQCGAREEQLVRIAQGPVRGYKQPEHDIFAFYGVPYATIPKGKQKFKAPLPAPTWASTFEAVNKKIICPQIIIPYVVGDDVVVQEDCLVADIYVPDSDEKNLPVAVYVHGGSFQVGFGSAFTAKHMVNEKKFIMVTFNYRLGIHGFLCLGTENVPGNAGMKDQVALLRWVKNNIESFGGNPEDVTIWGSSAGSASVELLMLSPLTKGLYNKVILESGSSLAPFAVQIDPIANAKEYAIKQNFSDVDNIYALEEFYTTASFETFLKDIEDRKDSTYLFRPCVERKTEEAQFLKDSPYNIFKSGEYEKVPILYGFNNMEGLMRLLYFEAWIDNMNENFSEFLSPDMHFKDDNEKALVSRQIKEFYFGDGIITKNKILSYLQYFTDVAFIYPTLRSVKLQVKAGHNKIYLYEYSYVNEHDPVNSPLVPYTDNVRGASHCAQSAAVLDGLGFLRVKENIIPEDFKNVKSYMRELWINFIITGSPVPSGSSMPQWPPVSAENGAPHMSLGASQELRSALHEQRVRFWDDIYERHYSEPQAPPAPPARRTEL